jgi:hypothetical protein
MKLILRMNDDKVPEVLNMNVKEKCPRGGHHTKGRTQKETEEELWVDGKA